MRASGTLEERLRAHVQPTIALAGFEGRFSHRKVKLDEASGAGAVDLSEG